MLTDIKNLYRKIVLFTTFFNSDIDQFKEKYEKKVKVSVSVRS